MTLEEQLIASIAWATAREAGGSPPLILLPAPGRRTRELPASCYYIPDAAELLAPPPVRMRDESRLALPSERDARALVRQSRERLLRFFAGRYSRRLGRVVRPV